MIHDLIVWSAWAAVWYVVGSATGAKVQHHKITRELLMQARDAKTWLKRRFTTWNVVAVLMLLVAAQTLYGQHQHNTDTSRIAAATARAEASAEKVKALGQCVATYENQLSASLHPRQRASKKLQKADERFNDALITLLTDALVLHPDPSRNKEDAIALKQAAQHKHDVAARLNAERVRKPYPAPPKEVCPQ